MERLTARDGEFVKWKGRPLYMMGAADIYTMAERLTAYEDTDLTPEEINAPFTEDTMINLAAQALGVEADRLRELAEADKDGRCVVLPCKVGDTVWFIPDGKRVCECEVLFIDSKDCDATILLGSKFGLKGTTQRHASSFGKTVFLTREEAEKALQEMEGKKDGKT
jgi:hypothetical protein